MNKVIRRRKMLNRPLWVKIAEVGKQDHASTSWQVSSTPDRSVQTFLDCLSSLHDRQCLTPEVIGKSLLQPSMDPKLEWIILKGWSPPLIAFHTIHRLHAQQLPWVSHSISASTVKTCHQLLLDPICEVKHVTEICKRHGQKKHD